MDFDGLSRSEIRELVERWLPLRSDLEEKVAEAARMEIAQAIEAGALTAATATGISPSFDVFNPKVAEWIREYVVKLSCSVADTILEQLSDQLSEGIVAGETLLQMRGRVGSVMGDQAGKYRAEMIAATEVARAECAGQDLQMKEFGARRKVWRANPEACEWCRALDGMTISIDEVFFEQGTSLTIPNADGGEKTTFLDYSDIPTPPLHPWCRCDVSYEF